MKADLAELLGATDDLMVVFDGPGDLVWCNAAFERALGLPAEAMIGRSLHSLLQEEGSEPWAWTTLLTNSSSGSIEVRIHLGNLGWRWVEWKFQRAPTSQRVVARGCDITERRMGRDLEARTDVIIENSPAHISACTMDGRLLIANLELRRFVGVSDASSVVGLHAGNLFPSWPGWTMASPEHVVAVGGKTVTEETRYGADGQGKTFSVVRSIVSDAAGRPEVVVEIATDISARRAAEESVREGDRLLDTILGASPDGISLIDRDGRISRVSQSDWSTPGVESVPTLDALELLAHPDDVARVSDGLRRMRESKESQVTVRCRLRAKGGLWVTVDSRAQALFDDDGEFAGAVVVSRDVSASIEVQRRLREAIEVADHASAAKSEFLSRMSHELRTPLNSVLGFAQLLGMDDLAASQHDAVQHIFDAGRHLLDLIDEVLDIARIETGHFDVDLEAVSVSSAFGDATEATGAIAERMNVTVRVSAGANPLVKADRNRLLQVLSNLLSNAAKYNRPGGQIDVKCEPAGPGWARLLVVDTGRGIQATDLDRVFEPFERLGAEQFGVEGSGVGLALSKHLIEHMGGRLGVESLPAVGSTFWVELPTVTPEESAELAGNTARDLPGAAPRFWRA